MIMSFNEVTLDQLKQIFRDNNLDYYVKKEKGNLVKVHFIVKEEK